VCCVVLLLMLLLLWLCCGVVCGVGVGVVDSGGGNVVVAVAVGTSLQCFHKFLNSIFLSLNFPYIT